MRTIIVFIVCMLLPALLYGAEHLKARALLVPVREAVISSRIDGCIVSLPVEAGDCFKKGQLLVELDCRILNAELQKAKMDLEAAVEIHGAKLRLKKFGSASELEVAVSSAKKKRAQAEVLLKEAKVNMCCIQSPFRGRVVKRMANPYENVTPEDPILEILDDRQLKLHLLVPSNWLQWLRKDCRFALRIDETGKEYQAVVTGMGARVNPVNQTLEVEAAFVKDHGELLAGMSGTAVFVLPVSKQGAR